MLQHDIVKHVLLKFPSFTLSKNVFISIILDRILIGTGPNT